MNQQNALQQVVLKTKLLTDAHNVPFGKCDNHLYCFYISRVTVIVPRNGRITRLMRATHAGGHRQKGTGHLIVGVHVTKLYHAIRKHIAIQPDFGAKIDTSITLSQYHGLTRIHQTTIRFGN